MRRSDLCRDVAPGPVCTLQYSLQRIWTYPGYVIAIFSAAWLAPLHLARTPPKETTMPLIAIPYLGGVLTVVSPCMLPILPFVFVRAWHSFVRSTLAMLYRLEAGNGLCFERDRAARYRAKIFPSGASLKPLESFWKLDRGRGAGHARSGERRHRPPLQRSLTCISCLDRTRRQANPLRDDPGRQGAGRKSRRRH